jgi:hypothetical protein
VASVATPEAYSLTDSALIITIALLALLVGASLPVFYQLVMTLKSARRFFDQTGTELGSALAQIREAAARIRSRDRPGAVDPAVEGYGAHDLRSGERPGAGDTGGISSHVPTG